LDARFSFDENKRLRVEGTAEIINYCFVHFVIEI